MFYDDEDEVTYLESATTAAVLFLRFATDTGAFAPLPGAFFGVPLIIEGQSNQLPLYMIDVKRH